MKRKVKYELPELEEMKRLTNEFFKEADEFIKRQKKQNKKKENS